MAIIKTQNKPQNLAPIFRTESSGHISWYPYPSYYYHAGGGGGGDRDHHPQQVLVNNNNSSSNNFIEKRQLFLRSYQFSRKKSLTERIKHSLIKAKKVIWLKLKSARKMKKLVWSELRNAVYSRRRRVARLMNRYNYFNLNSCNKGYDQYYFLINGSRCGGSSSKRSCSSKSYNGSSSSSSSCLW